MALDLDSIHIRLAKAIVNILVLPQISHIGPCPEIPTQGIICILPITVHTYRILPCQYIRAVIECRQSRVSRVIDIVLCPEFDI